MRVAALEARSTGYLGIHRLAIVYLSSLTSLCLNPATVTAFGSLEDDEPSKAAEQIMCPCNRITWTSQPTEQGAVSVDEIDSRPISRLSRARAGVDCFDFLCCD